MHQNLCKDRSSQSVSLKIMASPINPVIEECKRLRKTLIPISDKYHGLMEQISSRNTLYPFVLLLGNHSSGKSSFINHILKRKVQTTGVAPTDDNFTIIGPGESDIDRNGPALVGDPDLGFSGLKAFGPVLVNHTHLKVRANTAISDFMIVDSPGMIDSPVTSKSTASGPVGMDRGYNFEGVCRWYAERADVILLFFDPDKPGTTGETLSILTTALVGLDHKMYIILNKADQFHKIHDFARAYGSLCWNLSKVIPRKDLPRIHTMCLPVKSTTLSESPFDPTNASNNSLCSSPVPGLVNHSESNSIVSLSDGNGLAAFAERANFASPASPVGVSGTPTAITTGNNKTFFEQGVHDLEESRAEVELETFNAPRRRVDNEISRLTETVSALLMHCKILDRVMETYHDKLWRARFYTAATIVGSVAVTVAANYLCDFLLPSSAPVASAAPAAETAPAAVGAKPAQGGYLRGTAAAATSAAKSAKAALPTPAEVSSVTSSLYSEMFNFRSKRTIMSWVGVSGLFATGSVIAWAQYRITRLLNTFNEKSTFEGIYRQIYQKELAAQDEFTIALGRTVLDEISVNINSEVVQRTQRVYKPDFFALNRILNEDIANLRRRASPNFPTLGTPVKLPSALSHGHTKGTNSGASSQYANQAPSPNTEQLEHLALAVQAQEAVARQHHSRVHFSPSTTTSPVTTRDPLQKKSKRFFDRSKGGSNVIVLDNGPAAAVADVDPPAAPVESKAESVEAESSEVSVEPSNTQEDEALPDNSKVPNGSSDSSSQPENLDQLESEPARLGNARACSGLADCSEKCVTCVNKRVHCENGVEESKRVVCEYSQCTWNAQQGMHAHHASRTQLHAQALDLPVDAYFDAIVSD